IPAFDASGRTNLGHSLETAVLNELERRRAESGYVKTADGLEVDFLVRYRSGEQELVQVCANLKSPETVARELRALAAAAREHPRARRRLLVLDRDAAGEIEAPGVEVLPAYEWMLAGPG
ncbi:MAG: ATP-binding protein, partial [Steroidobacteraceae bacterium]